MRPFIFRSHSSILCTPAAALAMVVLILALTLRPSLAAETGDFGERIAGDPKVPWQISADTVNYDAAETTYHARGDVVIAKGETRLAADRVAFNHQAMTAMASGHVVLVVGKDVLSGERLDLNLGEETGVLHGGTLFLEENHFYIRGERIEKTGPETYHAERASVTTCNGDDPDWTITGRDVKVTVEGYGSATHAAFKAGPVPVLYTPYILFPVKTRRQTGLLFPEFGYSDRKGFFWEQPLFWAINDSSDATVYLHHMQERGTKLGLEYRWALSDDSLGVLMADGLKDRQIDDGTTDATKNWGYAGDRYDRTNQDRYWLRGKVDQTLPFQAMAHLDLDIVSDQDYLDEFRDGPSGFDATQAYFEDAFGRDIDTYDENTRTNRLNINRGWAHYSLNADARWNDNVVNRRWSETDTTLQQLPVIEFDSTKQRLLGSGVYWDVASEYVYFYREDGDRGHRTDIHPRAYLPLRWKNYLSIEPSAGFRQTTWIMDRWEDEDLEQTSYRQIPDFELDVSTAIAKVMSSPIAGVDRIRHNIKPRIVYSYIPKQDQSDLPYFTQIDRIEETSLITYSLTNTFTARMPKPTPPVSPGSDVAPTDDDRPDGAAARPAAAEAAAAKPAPAAPMAAYREFCRVYLEQSYDIAAARDNDPEPFSDIYGELDLHFGAYFSVGADAEYDTYDNRFNSRNFQGRFSDARGDKLAVEYRYNTDVNESIQTEIAVVLTDHITMRAEYERNLLEEEEISRGVGLNYKTQCWAVDIFYAEEEEDKSIAVFITLNGIGQFGN